MCLQIGMPCAYMSEPTTWWHWVTFQHVTRPRTTSPSSTNSCSCASRLALNHKAHTCACTNKKQKHTHTHTHTHTRTHAHTHAHTYPRTRVRTLARMHTRAYTNTLTTPRATCAFTVSGTCGSDKPHRLCSNSRNPRRSCFDLARTGISSWHDPLGMCPKQWSIPTCRDLAIVHVASRVCRTKSTLHVMCVLNNLTLRLWTLRFGERVLCRWQLRYRYSKSIGFIRFGCYVIIKLFINHGVYNVLWLCYYQIIQKSVVL